MDETLCILNLRSNLHHRKIVLELSGVRKRSRPRTKRKRSTLGHFQGAFGGRPGEVWGAQGPESLQQKDVIFSRWLQGERSKLSPETSI